MRKSAGQEAAIVSKKFKQLKSAKRFEFPKPRGKLEAPNKRGVYVIYGRTGKVLHVGATPRGKNGIANRLRNHLQTQSSFAWNFPQLKRQGSRLREGYKFSFLAVQNPHIRAFLESYAIGRLCPRHIGVTLEARGKSKSGRKK
jgi:hypothetical protein